MTVRQLRFWACERGAVAVEFTLVLPFCIFLIIGSVYISLALYTQTSLNASVEAAARYASTYAARYRTQAGTTYPTSTIVTTYAQGQYKGLRIGPTFTYRQPSQTGNTCAQITMHQVTATADFRVITGIVNPVFHLNAASCYP